MKVSVGPRYDPTPIKEGDYVGIDELKLPLQIEYPCPKGSARSLYTVIVYDLNAPAGIFLHYLAVNIPCDEQPDEEDILAEYVTPAPPQGTGTHTYVVGVYRSKRRISEYELTERVPFDVEEFIEEEQLTEVGSLSFNVRSPSKPVYGTRRRKGSNTDQEYGIAGGALAGGVIGGLLGGALGSRL